LDPQWRASAARPVVTTALLGRARVPGLPFVHPDDSPYRLDHDYLGVPHPADRVFPGPVEWTPPARHSIKLWPLPPDADN
jgi:alpha-N-arabinofuranosidase